MTLAQPTIALGSIAKHGTAIGEENAVDHSEETSVGIGEDGDLIAAEEGCEPLLERKENKKKEAIQAELDKGASAKKIRASWSVRLMTMAHGSLVRARQILETWVQGLKTVSPRRGGNEVGSGRIIAFCDRLAIGVLAAESLRSSTRHRPSKMSAPTGRRKDNLCVRKT